MASWLFRKSNFGVIAAIPLGRSWQRLLIALVSWTTSLQVFGPSRVSAEPLPSMDVVRAAYIQSVSSIRTLDCRYRVTSSAPEIDKQLSGRLSWYNIHDIRDGNKLSILFEAGSRPNVPAIRYWVGFDGKNYSSWTESLKHGGGYFAPAGSRTDLRPIALKDPFQISRFWGAELFGGMDMAELLALPEAKVIAAEKVDGGECVVIDIGVHPESAASSRKYHTKVWLDKQHGLLPRKIQSHFVVGEPLDREIVVSKFKTTHQTSGQMIYLPATATYRKPQSEIHFVLEHFVLNEPISVTHFVPNYPVGTSVVDNRGGKKPKEEIVGGKAARRPLLLKSVQQRDHGKTHSQAKAGGIAPSSSVPDNLTRYEWVMWLRPLGFSGLFAVSLFCAWRFWRQM